MQYVVTVVHFTAKSFLRSAGVFVQLVRTQPITFVKCRESLIVSLVVPLVVLAI